LGEGWGEGFLKYTSPIRKEKNYLSLKLLDPLSNSLPQGERTFLYF